MATVDLILLRLDEEMKREMLLLQLSETVMLFLNFEGKISKNEEI